MSQEDKLEFTIQQMQPEDVEAVGALNVQSWLDTYVHEEYGVTKGWILKYKQSRNTPQEIQKRKEQIIKNANNSDQASYVAKDTNGKVIGFTAPYRDEKAIQHVGALYVDKKFHGQGVGSALMQKVVDWADSDHDIILGVADYNENAISFYENWGFKKAGQIEMFAGKIPQIRMIRKGDKR